MDSTAGSIDEDEGDDNINEITNADPPFCELMNNEDTAVNSLAERCLLFCAEITTTLQQNFLQECDPDPTLQDRSTSLPRSTVGLLLNGIIVDQLVIGGPAFICGKLQAGDVIVEVDGKLATPENIASALLGHDIPGSKVTITYKKNHASANLKALRQSRLWYLNSALSSNSDLLPAPLQDHPNAEVSSVATVELTRMDSDIVSDRRRFFERLTMMKVQAQVRNDSSTMSTIEDCINIWIKMLHTDENRGCQFKKKLKTLHENVITKMQAMRCLVESMYHKTSAISDSQPFSRLPRSLLGDSFNQEEETESSRPSFKAEGRERSVHQELQEDELARMQELVRRLNIRMQDSISLQEHIAAVATLQKLNDSMVSKSLYDEANDEIRMKEMEIERLQKNVALMVPKIQLEAANDEILKSNLDISRLQERMQNMAALAELSIHERDERFKAEIARLQKVIDSRVPREDLIAAVEEVKRSCLMLERSEAENQCLKLALEAANLEAAGRLSGAQDECFSLSAQISRLEDQIKKMVPRQIADDIKNENQKLRETMAETVPKAALEALQANAQGLQQNIGNMITRAQHDTVVAELRDMKARMGRMLSNVILDSVQRQRCKDEADLLEERIRQVVHKDDLAAALAEIKTLTFEVLRLQGLIEGMVPACELAAARSLAVRTEHRLELAQRDLQGSVPKERVESAAEDARHLTVQLDQHRERMSCMVPRSDLAEAQAETEGMRTEVMRLQKVLEGTIPRPEYDAALDEIRRLKLEAERLKRSVDASVPKSQWTAMQDDAIRWEHEAVRLRERLKATASKTELESQSALARRLESELDAAREQMTAMIGRDEYMALEQKLDDRNRHQKSELDTLRRLIESMVPKADAEAEATRLRRLVDARVSMDEHEAAKDEAAAARARADQLERTLSESVPRADLCEVKDLAAGLRRRVGELEDDLCLVREELSQANRRVTQSRGGSDSLRAAMT